MTIISPFSHTPQSSAPTTPGAHVPVQPVATSSEEKNWLREKGKAHEVFTQRRANIAARFADGKRVQADVRNFLGNPKVRLSAALRALGGNPTRQEAHDLCSQVNAWSESYPQVSWYPKKKRSGGYRPICRLPLELKAVHIMIAAVIGAQIQQSPALYGIPGASRDDAAKAVKALQNNGFTHLAKADIRNCFQSINPDSLSQLPLPKEVKNRAIKTKALSFIRMSEDRTKLTSGYSKDIHDDVRNPSGPQGLMQGSPASSIILAWLLGGIPQSDAVAVFLCFDNLCLAGRTAESTRAMMNTLVGYFSRCPAGPLELRDIDYFDGEHVPLSFLGYSFDPEQSALGIGADALTKLERRLLKAEENDRKNPQTFPVEIWKVLRDFRNGFPAVEYPAKTLAIYLDSCAAEVEARRSYLVSHLHQHLFASRDSAEGKMIDLIIRKYG